MTEFSVNGIFPAGNDSYYNTLREIGLSSGLTIMSIFTGNKVPKGTKDTPHPFGFETSKEMMRFVPHKTNLLNIAQNYLGIMEVTPDELAKMSPSEKRKTQALIIGDKGKVDEAWCAHTVSFLSKKAGMNVGPYKKAVSAYIHWAKENKSWRPIETKQMTGNNIGAERKSRAIQIQKQLKNMKEADFIVWKSQFSVKTNKGIKNVQASHIGIIESVDTKKGTVTVIEGNANISKSSNGTERYVVENDLQGVYGNQSVGEFQEVNRTDGLIRKTYTVDELAKFGYSGFIDNSKIAK